MKKKAGIITVTAVLTAALACFFIFMTIQNEKDKMFLKAHDYMSAGKYDEAEALLEKIPNYNGASDLLLQVIYERACMLFDEGKEAEAEKDFQKITDYQNAKEYLDTIALHRAEIYMGQNQYQEAETALAHVTKTKNMVSFMDELYRNWGKSALDQQDYQTAYQAVKKIKNPIDSDKETIHKATLYYAKEVLNKGNPDEAEKMLQELEQTDDVTLLVKEINDTRLAVTCIKELQGRYTGETSIGDLLEIRCKDQSYRNNIQIPVVMIRFIEKDIATGQEREAYAIYDNDVYLLTCHSLIKENVDIKNPTEMSGYLKLSQNWDSTETITLSLEGIKVLLQK